MLHQDLIKKFDTAFNHSINGLLEAKTPGNGQLSPSVLCEQIKRNLYQAANAQNDEDKNNNLFTPNRTILQQVLLPKLSQIEKTLANNKSNDLEVSNELRDYINDIRDITLAIVRGEKVAGSEKLDTLSMIDLNELLKNPFKSVEEKKEEDYRSLVILATDNNVMDVRSSHLNACVHNTEFLSDMCRIIFNAINGDDPKLKELGEKALDFIATEARHNETLKNNCVKVIESVNNEKNESKDISPNRLMDVLMAQHSGAQKILDKAETLENTRSGPGLR